MKTYIMNLENCSLPLFKEMLKKISFDKDDRLYVLGGMFEQKTPEEVKELLDYFMQNKENIEYILGYKEYLYTSFSDFAKKINEKSKDKDMYSRWYLLYKATLEKEKDFFYKMAGILKENPLYMTYLRSCSLYKLIYSLGYQYLMIYGSPPMPSAEREEKNEHTLKKNHALMTTAPAYEENYRIQLLQGELIYGKSTKKETLTEQDLEKTNEIAVVLISARDKTGSLIVKKERTKMPILDTGSVIAIRTGGAGGKTENDMETQISCIELNSGQIYYL